jgi:hypothetical protein
LHSVRTYCLEIPYFVYLLVTWLGLREGWAFFVYLLAGLGWVALGVRVVFPLFCRADLQGRWAVWL